MIFGHKRIQENLAALPFPVTLLLGPESVGKRAVARQLIRANGGVHDFLEIQQLTSAGSRVIQDFVSRAPLSSPRKFVLVDLGEASEPSCHQLLKVLEEPPSWACIVLTAAAAPLATIMSRSIVTHCGLLTEEEVAGVLVQCGMEDAVARRLAPLGAGTVRPALEGEHSGPGRSRVSRVLRALGRRDLPQLTAALRDWDAEAAALLALWAQEAASGQWHAYDASFAPGFPARDARLVLGALGRHPCASPRLAASSALAPLCAR
jgi:hypothetical protein